MQHSRSKYIRLESVPFPELFRRPPDSVGIYIPEKDDKGLIKTSIARICASAKASATQAGKRCLTQIVMVLQSSDEQETPTVEKYVQVTVKDRDDISPTGQRYLAAKAAGRA